MDKITWTEAAKMEKDLGAYTIHLDYISKDLAAKHPDCAAMVIDGHFKLRDPKGWLFLVLDDPELEDSIGGFYTRLAKR